MHYLNGASGAAPQQGIRAPDRAPDLWFLFILFIFILHNEELLHQTGHQTFSFLFYKN